MNSFFLIRYGITIVLIVGALFSVFPAHAQVMQSTNFRIESDSANVGGGYSASANYLLEGTTGEVATGFSQSGNYMVSAGYQQPLEASATSTPTPQAEAGSLAGGGVVGTLVALHITPYERSAGISWETSIPTQFVLSWGRTLSYEMGTLTGPLFARVHQTEIQNLMPQTRYELMLTTIDQYGNKRIVARTHFITRASMDTIPPANVREFTATADGNNVRLSWQNPLDYDFSRVRVMRAYDFYPSTPNEGTLVYEGSAANAVDVDALLENDNAYYTAFALDREGNVSSGALAQARRAGVPVTERPQSTSTLELSLDDIIFTQNGITVPYRTTEGASAIHLDSTRPFTVSIPYDAVLENLKTIIVTLTHPDDEMRAFSFLLRINSDKSAYEAHIAPLVYGGEYPTDVTLIDYELSDVAHVSARIIASHAEEAVPLDGASSDNRSFFTLIALGAFVCVAFALGALFVRRKYSYG